MAKKVLLGPKPQQPPRVTPDEWVQGAASSPDAHPGVSPAASGQMAPRAEATEPGTVSSTSSANTPEAPADSPSMKRLTIDVPEALHAQIKSRCALKGVKMADEIRALLETHFLTGDKP